MSRCIVLTILCLLVMVKVEAKNDPFNIPLNSINKVEVLFYDFDIYTTVTIVCETFEELAKPGLKIISNKRDIYDLMLCLNNLKIVEGNIEKRINVIYPDKTSGKMLLYADGKTLTWNGVKYRSTKQLVDNLNKSFSVSSEKILLKNKKDVEQFTKYISELHPIADIIDTRAKINIYTEKCIIPICVGEFDAKVIGESNVYKLTRELKDYIINLFNRSDNKMNISE